MKKAGFFALAAITALVLTGCTDSDAPAGGDTSDGGSGDSAELTPVTVGVIPIADTAALYLGEDQGFFEDEGLDLTIETATGGAAIVPAVVSGDYEFGFSNQLSLMVAADQGLDIQMVSSAVATTGDTTKDMGAVVTKADSGIASPADLAGKTVSSNSVGNINDTAVRSVVDESGADSSTIEFVEVPFPDAIAAVENDQVDAAFVVEPFVTAAVDAGLEVVTYAYADFDPKLDIAAYFALNSVDADLLSKFQAAMQKSLEYADANPDAVREIMATYTSTPPEVLANITLPKYPTEFDRASSEKLAAAALEYGVLKAEPDFDALLP
ncbi:ABC transporter substrate-binding protein [Microbacterium sp. NPDC077644]|uniref:ABC transporter substrate-binding protein n=1 Tax=Microbacterium sp. NPDC077644 TaxID=3155055 RepID=UPI00344C3856